MALYQTAGTALLFAFNDSLFCEHSRANWIEQARNTLNGLDVTCASEPVTNRLSRRDWLTQSGMVRGYLRTHMTPQDYAWLRITHTWDEYDRLVWQQWSDEAVKLMQDSKRIRQSIKKHPQILRALVKRALLPRYRHPLPVPKGLRYKTLENWASEVRGACVCETQRVRTIALRLIEDHPDWIVEDGNVP